MCESWHTYEWVMSHINSGGGSCDKPTKLTWWFIRTISSSLFFRQPKNTRIFSNSLHIPIHSDRGPASVARWIHELSARSRDVSSSDIQQIHEFWHPIYMHEFWHLTYTQTVGGVPRAWLDKSTNLARRPWVFQRGSIRSDLQNSRISTPYKYTNSGTLHAVGGIPRA